MMVQMTNKVRIVVHVIEYKIVRHGCLDIYVIYKTQALSSALTLLDNVCYPARAFGFIKYFTPVRGQIKVKTWCIW